MSQIWFGKEINKIRNLHKQKDLNSIEICKNVILQIPTHGQKLTNIKFINEIASTHDGSTKELNKLVKDIKINKGLY